MIEYAGIALQYLIATGTVVPATVAVAILIFICREFLEHRRRKASDKRKIAAIKRFIARDLELCQRSVETIRSALGILTRVEEDGSEHVKLITAPSGNLRYEVWTDNDPMPSYSAGITPVVDAFSARFAMEIATLDADFYNRFEVTVDTLADLQHVRNSLIENVEDDLFRESFINWATQELHEIESSILGMYSYCTGNNKIESRPH